jgi:hypothetical protein
MKQKILVFLMVLTMVFSCSVAMASEDVDTGGGNTDIDIDGTTFYYDRFDNTAYRNVYDQLAAVADTFHNSTTSATYSEGADGSVTYIAFSFNISKKDWDVINAGGLEYVVNGFRADHPTYFWMSEDYSYQFHSTDAGSEYYTVNIFCYSSYANGTARQVIKNNMDYAISEYVAMTDDTMPNYEKAYIVHNAIIEDASYNSLAVELDEDNEYAFTIDGIVNSSHRSANSFGYAKAFKAVMDALNIPCIYVQGNQVVPEDKDAATYDSHAWNEIYYDGDWYIVDVSYDDPETTTGKQVLMYDYFNITSTKATNLTPNYEFLPGIPDCNGTAYSIDKIQSQLEKDGLWQKDNYNFIDKMLDTYGVSVVLISLGIILLLVVLLIKRMHKKGVKKKQEKIKKTKVQVVDHSELDRELKKPPLS